MKPVRHWTVSLFLLAGLLLGTVSATARAARALSPGSQTKNATPSAVATPAADTPLTFAAIGDYGTHDAHEAAVADLVTSWNPASVIATGDGYYKCAGGTGKYDESTGAYYGTWLKDISTTGLRHPTGEATTNAFFPALGNHDYAIGPVHFFVLNSNTAEPSGTTSASAQGQWLKAQLTPSAYSAL